MGGNGKHRWKISFFPRSSQKQQPQPQQQQPPPKEFLCPISGALMFDPVVVASGQTFERLSVQVCRDLGFVPNVENGFRPDFATVIPNLNFKSAILNWCDKNSTEQPRALDYHSIERILRSQMKSDPDIRVSEVELLKGVAENPPFLTLHADSLFVHRASHFYSSSSEESVIVTGSPFTPLPLATRPACFSTSSSSSEITEAEIPTLNPRFSSSSSTSPEEEEIYSKLRSSDIFDQEQGVILMRRITRTREEARVSLCTPRLTSVLRNLILSKYTVVHTNALASLVNLSLEKQNKLMIVRSGFVPLLIDILKSGSTESQEHAAGALFSLALEDENKMAIGVLGALQPLLHTLRSDSDRARHDSSLALYHLSLIQSNRAKLVKLGAVSTLLSMVQSGESANRVLLVLCNLAACNEGRSAMLDGNAVSILVGILRDGGTATNATGENCVAALLALSHGSLRFKGLAKKARVVEALREVEERGSDRAREKAKKLLQTLKEREEEGGELDWEGILESGEQSRTQFRVGKNGNGPNSTKF